MKIIKNNEIYIQINDLACIHNLEQGMPLSTCVALLDSNRIQLPFNRFEFIKLEEPEKTQLIDYMDWIVDYESLSNLSQEKIMELGESIVMRRKKLFDELDSNLGNMTSVQLLNEITKLEYQKHEIGNLALFKRGVIKFIFPEELVQQEETTKHMDSDKTFKA